jgi:hypothetical protein
MAPIGWPSTLGKPLPTRPIKLKDFFSIFLQAVQNNYANFLSSSLVNESLANALSAKTTGSSSNRGIDFKHLPRFIHWLAGIQVPSSTQIGRRHDDGSLALCKLYLSATVNQLSTVNSPAFSVGFAQSWRSESSDIGLHVHIDYTLRYILQYIK